MPKYTVYLCTAQATFEDIEAEDREAAHRAVIGSKEFDFYWDLLHDTPWVLVVREQEDENEQEI